MPPAVAVAATPASQHAGAPAAGRLDPTARRGRERRSRSPPSSIACCAPASRAPRTAAASAPIIVTSPNKGDGKSLTAANLALTMAQEFQQRVLLLDADFRRPSIARLFGISETPGLATSCSGGATLDDALVT